MDRSYLRETPLQFSNSVVHKPWARGAAYYLWTANSEAVVRLAYAEERLQHHVMSVGFVGDMSPQQALDQIVQCTIDYLIERRARSVFAIAPKRMDSQEVLNLYDLVPTHPRLRVITEAESPRGRRWNIDFPELQIP